MIEQIEPSVAATVSREVLRRQLEEIIHRIANKERLELSGREQLQMADEPADDMMGYGPLRPPLLDDSVNAVMVNGPNNVYVGRNGVLERVAVRCRANDHIASVAQKIAARVGWRIDESSPMVDCRLPDGSRVNIIFPPLAIHSPCISIRKFPSRRYDSGGMIENGTISPGVGRLLEIAARTKLNILLSGGTGSGKTILLNAAIIATGVNTEGRREIPCLGLGPSEAPVFWLGFLRKVEKLRLKGVKLVISDAHKG